MVTNEIGRLSWNLLKMSCWENNPPWQYSKSEKKSVSLFAGLIFIKSRMWWNQRKEKTRSCLKKNTATEKERAHEKRQWTTICPEMTRLLELMRTDVDWYWHLKKTSAMSLPVIPAVFDVWPIKEKLKNSIYLKTRKNSNANTVAFL